MKTLTEAALAAVLCLSVPAFAQDPGFSPPPLEQAVVSAPVQAGQPAPAEDVHIDQPRVRFGIGGYAGLETSAGPTGGGLIGLSGQLGIQINDDYAVYALAQGSTVLGTTIGNASLIVERQFFGHLSVGTGVGVSTLQIAACLDLLGNDSCPGNEQISAMVPVRLAVNMGFTDPKGGARSRFYIAFDGAVGMVVGNTGSATGAAPMGSATFAGGLSLGYTLM